MRHLRLYGIYKLPGMLRPVYPISAEGKFYLYDAKYGTSVPPRFVVEEDGRIVNWHGERTSLTDNDLIDTGKSFEPRDSRQ
jgi:hypothetical protein